MKRRLLTLVTLPLLLALISLSVLQTQTGDTAAKPVSFKKNAPSTLD